MIIEIKNVLKLEEKERLKIVNAVSFGNVVLQSAQLMNAWDKYPDCSEDKGMSNHKIYEFITKFDEKLVIEIEGFYKPSTTIGYTYVNSRKEWINRKYLKQDYFGPDYVYGHISHEIAHMIGFVHKYWKGTSIPYAWGKCNRETYKILERDSREMALKSSFFQSEIIRIVS